MRSRPSARCIEARVRICRCASGEAHILASLAPNPRLLAAELSTRRERLRASRRRAISTRAGVADVAVRRRSVYRVTAAARTASDVQVELVPKDGLHASAAANAYSRRRFPRAVRLRRAPRPHEKISQVSSRLKSRRTRSAAIYASAAMRRLLAQIRQVARTDLTVLIRWRDGNGQGDRRRRSARVCRGARSEPIRAIQRDGRAARHARGTAVRLSPRRVHRRRQRCQGADPRGRRRHAVHRRDRRTEPRPAAQAAALPRERRNPAARRAATEGRRPHRRRDQRAPRGTGARRAASARTSSIA